MYLELSWDTRFMKDTINEVLYKEVALELGVSEKVVQDVINNGESKCTASIVTSNTFDGVKWPYMGSFKAKHKAVQILNYLKGLNEIQRGFFLDALKTGRFKELAINGKSLEQFLQEKQNGVHKAKKTKT